MLSFKVVLKSIAFQILFLVFFVAPAMALSLTDSTSNRGDFSITNSQGSFSVANVDANSYDGPGYNAFTPFESFTNSDVLSVSSFDGGADGSILEFTLLSSVAYYDGFHEGYGADEFGVTSSDGSFVSALSFADGLGATGTITQAAGEDMTLALLSPESLFTSIDGDNEDKDAHILAQEVTRAGTVTIEDANLFGASFSFDLQVGDLVIYVEDLLAGPENQINQAWCDMGMCDSGDFDWNDGILVVRASAIPEPSTYAMMLLAMLLLYLHTRRKEELA